MHKNDFINMEYEARSMINESQYEQILSDFKKKNNKKRFSVNSNTYFDYEDLYLTNHHMVLRTRSISENQFELTLKVKGENGDKEINHLLTFNEYKDIRENVSFPNSLVKDELIKLGIDLSKLKLIADLNTERLEIFYKNHIVVIDKNYFRNRMDYNVEVESISKKSAIFELNRHFSKYEVTYKKGYISKSRRAIFDL